MSPCTSVLLLQTECDFSQLPALWTALEVSTKNPRQVWERLVSQKRLEEAPLRCDILLLPSGNGEEDQAQDSMYDDDIDDDENDSGESGYRTAEQGLVVYPGQILLPCGNDNVLSLERNNEDRSSFHHLSLSECSLQLSESLWLPLSPSFLHYYDDMNWANYHHQGGMIRGDSHLAQTTRSLTLDSHLDKNTINIIDQERIHAFHLHDLKENQQSEIKANQQSVTTNSISDENNFHVQGQTSKRSQELHEMHPQPSSDLNHCKPCHPEESPALPNTSAFYQSSPSQHSSTQLHLQLLEERLEEELRSIQSLTYLIVILPIIVLSFLGVWMISFPWQGIPPLTMRPCADSIENKSDTALRCDQPSIVAPRNGSLVGSIDHRESKATSPKISVSIASSVINCEGVDPGKRPHNDTIDVASDFKANRERTTSKESAEQHASPTDVPPSPCTLLKLQWKAKQQLKQHEKLLTTKREKETKEMLALPSEKLASLISPDSTPEPKLRRSSRGMSNLLLAGQREEPKVQSPHLRPTQGNGTNRNADGRLHGSYRTNTFVDDYW